MIEKRKTAMPPGKKKSLYRISRTFLLKLLPTLLDIERTRVRGDGTRECARVQYIKISKRQTLHRVKKEHWDTESKRLLNSATAFLPRCLPDTKICALTEMRQISRKSETWVYCRTKFLLTGYIRSRGAIWFIDLIVYCTHFLALKSSLRP